VQRFCPYEPYGLPPCISPTSSPTTAAITQAFPTAPTRFPTMLPSSKDANTARVLPLLIYNFGKVLGTHLELGIVSGSYSSAIYLIANGTSPLSIDIFLPSSASNLITLTFLSASAGYDCEFPMGSTISSFFANGIADVIAAVCRTNLPDRFLYLIYC
jgi:hypothetical protein